MRKILALLSALILALTTAAWFAQPASATKGGHVPVGVCHATSSDTNPYVWIVVDKDSVKYEGHLAHRNDPNKRWKSDGEWDGLVHFANDPKRDYIEGLDNITEAGCLSVVVTPTPTPTSTQNSTSPTPTPTETDCTEDCETPTPTPTETSSSPTPTPTHSTATPTPTHHSVTPTPTKPPVLAHTGSSTPYLMGLGLATVLAGAALLAGGRRRKGSHI